MNDTDLEHRLREVLLADSDRQIDVDGAWRRFRLRRHAAGRRRAAWLTVTAAVAVLSVITPLAVSGLEARPRSHQRPVAGTHGAHHAARPAATYPGAIVARIPAYDVVSIAAAGGSLWAMTESNELLRINLRTNAITLRTSIRGLGANGGTLAAGGGALWLAEDWGRRLLRLDPVTGTILASISLPWARCFSATYGLGHLWLACGVHATQIVRVDPATDRVDAHTKIHGSAASLVAGPEGVWFGGSRITQVDPSGRRLTGVTVNDAPFPVSLGGAELALGQGAVFAFTQDDIVAVIDPVTGRITRSISYKTFDPSVTFQPWTFAVGQNSLWLLGDFATDQVIRVSLRTGRVLGRVDAHGVGPEFDQLADAASAVWVSTPRALLRINPALMPG